MESPKPAIVEDSTVLITKIKSARSNSVDQPKMSENEHKSSSELEDGGAKIDIVDGKAHHNSSKELNGVAQQSHDGEEDDGNEDDFQLEPDSSVGSDIESKPTADEIDELIIKKEADETEEEFAGFDDNFMLKIKPIIRSEDISECLLDVENELLTEALNCGSAVDCDGGDNISEKENLTSGSAKKVGGRRSSKRVSSDDDNTVSSTMDSSDSYEGGTLEAGVPVSNVQKISKTSGRQGRTDSPATSGKRIPKRTSTFDISNPAFLKPFEYGWKRELVFRNASSADSNTKIQADVYYYSPKNKKIRSSREVSDHLSGSALTCANFTFFKEALGVDDPDKEIIRSAAQRSSIGGEGFVPIKKSPKKKETKETKEPKPVKEAKAPKNLKEAKSPKETKPPKDKSPKGPKEDHKDNLTVVGPKAVIGARKGAFPRIKVTPVVPKSSPSHKPLNSKLSRKSNNDGDMEMGMLPPSWSPSANKTSTLAAALTATPQSALELELRLQTPPSAIASKRKADETDEGSSLPKRVKLDEAVAERRFMQSFVSNVANGYNALLQVFQYLKTQELLRAARVCRMWRDLAGHRSLWRTVRLKNSHVDDWQGLIDALTRHGTQHLDLRKILVSNDIQENEQLWRTFSQGIGKVHTLTQVDLCRCPPHVVEDIALACPQLTTLNALFIKSSTINVTNLSNLKNLVELRLKSMTGTKLERNLQPIKELTNLKYLAMTTFKDFGQSGLENLMYLTNLEVLELGECLDLPENFGADVLLKLTKLERLRLEKGGGKFCHTFRLLAAIKELPKLYQLELINFDVKLGFDAALGQCTNIKRLLLIPTYVTQSATTNYLVFEGTSKLRATLSHFVWGVTQELLRVTELFVDQCDSTGSKSPVKSVSKKDAKLSESIPILKQGSLDRVENLENMPKDELKDKSQAGQVEIQSLHNLQKQLAVALPNTKIKIVKIPFQATWKQTIAEPPLHH